MAISLLAALIALGLLHLRPELAHWRGDAGFGAWVRMLGDATGLGRVLPTLAVPLVICALVTWLLERFPLADLLQLLFALAVLLFSFGPHAYEADIDTVLHAPDESSASAAAQKLSDDGSPVAWTAVGVGEATVYAALRRRFGVLFWFFLLGPAGALLYRLARTLRQDSSLNLDAGSYRGASYIANALDWLPAQLLVFTLALVGHWEAVIGSWKRWHEQAAPTSWYASGPDFLGAAARADVVTDLHDTDASKAAPNNPLTELRRLRDTLLRGLLAWLSVTALIVLAGWFD